MKKSHDPVVDLDWDAPPDPDKLFLPPEVISRYGTPPWDERDPWGDLRIAGIGAPPFSL